MAMLHMHSTSSFNERNIRYKKHIKNKLAAADALVLLGTH